MKEKASTSKHTLKAKRFLLISDFLFPIRCGILIFISTNNLLQLEVWLEIILVQYWEPSLCKNGVSHQGKDIGIIGGLMQAKALSLSNLIVKGDFVIVISWVTNKERGSWKVDN